MHSTPEARRFGRYEVVERIGVGAMGAVYRARDASLGRDVAVKTIHTMGRTKFQLELFCARFDNEARAVAALSHPHIVNVFDVGVEDETPFLVMELAEGCSLAQRLFDRGPLSAAEARVLGEQIALALGAAHAQGILHRDVKPANILEAEPGVWKLADFGVAHVPDSSLTLAGQFLGSPAYAAPEALARGAFSDKADVYSLGATLYEAVAGVSPYDTDGGVSTVAALAADVAPPPLAERCPGLPAPLAAAIMSALDSDPARRPSAEQLLAAIRGQAQPVVAAPLVHPVAPHRRGAVLAVVGLVLLLGIGFGVAMSSSGGGAPTSPARAPAGGAPAHDEPTAADARPEVPPLSERDRQHNEKDWREVRKKLDQGKPDHAVRKLDKILERDPYDAEARRLYRELTGEDWTGGRRHGKHRRRR